MIEAQTTEEGREPQVAIDAAETTSLLDSENSDLDFGTGARGPYSVLSQSQLDLQLSLEHAYGYDIVEEHHLIELINTQSVSTPHVSSGATGPQSALLSSVLLSPVQAQEISLSSNEK